MLQISSQDKKDYEQYGLVLAIKLAAHIIAFIPGVEADPVLEYLLQNARSDAVREEFLRQPEDEYTVNHTLKLMVGLPRGDTLRNPCRLDKNGTFIFHTQLHHIHTTCP